MEIAITQISKIKQAAYNPRKDLLTTEPKMKKIQRSVDKFGLVIPLVWNKKTGNLVSGHQRLKAIIATGATEVETTVVNLSKEDEKALNIAMNKIEGGWDFAKLRDVLEGLHGEDLELTGYDDSELQGLLSTFDEEEESEAAEDVALPMLEGGEAVRVYISFETKEQAEAFVVRAGITAKFHDGVANVDMT